MSKQSPKVHFLVGLVLGFTLTAWTPIHLGLSETLIHQHSKRCSSFLVNGSLSVAADSRSPKNLIFVGVMTTANFISTRAVAVNRTWAKTIPGRVTFFSGSSSDTPAAEWNLPVVSLPGVTDIYPPTKKFFIMLKYMYDNHIDDYDWFMRADDDAYIKGDRLATLLRSINGTGRHFVGQGALGRVEDRGRLYLGDGENFCMGGTGMILSRETLRKIGPHIRFCLKNVWSRHDDVEVSRCVQKFAGVPCTWAHETEDLFYQNYSGILAFTGNLHTQEQIKAITLHPIKQPPHMYRVHAYILSQIIAEKRQQILAQIREVRDMNELLYGRNWTDILGSFEHDADKLGLHPSLMKYNARSVEDIIPWKFIGSYLYSHNMHSPRMGVTKPVQTAVDDVVLQTMQFLNSDPKQTDSEIVLNRVAYGYSRLTSPYGVDYILNLLLRYRGDKTSKKHNSFRQSTYLTQTLGRIQLIEDDMLVGKEEARIFHRRENHESSSTLKEPVQDNITTKITSADKVHFILPLSGRLGTFKKFMATFEENFLVQEDSVALSVVLFRSFGNDQSEKIENILTNFKRRYPSCDIRLIHEVGNFNRALALNLGASQFPATALLFFVDVDMYVSKDFLLRCRQNTQPGSRVYYPSVFSQYNPDFFRGRWEDHGKAFTIDKETGFFIEYGYGMVCLYHSDLQRVGGMNDSIVGWGYEDVDLYMRIVSSNITIFRAPEPGLVHLYHPSNCAQDLDPQKYQMCIGSKSERYGSNVQLANRLQQLLLRGVGDMKELEEGRNYVSSAKANGVELKTKSNSGVA